MRTLQDVKNDLARKLYGQTSREANTAGLCIQCHEPAIDNCYSAAGRREYAISGLCEKCFDSICGK